MTSPFLSGVQGGGLVATAAIACATEQPDQTPRQFPPPMRNAAGLRFLSVLLASCLAGCAIHRYDAATGVHTVYGVGVLRLRADTGAEGKKAVASSLETWGASLGAGRDEFSFSLGYRRQDRLAIVSAETVVNLAYVQGGLFSVKLFEVPPPPETGAPVSTPRALSFTRPTPIVP